MVREWNRSLTVKLIALWEQYENLYNYKHSDYTNRVKRAECLYEICDELNKINKEITVECIKKKIKNLRTQYAREYRAVQASIESGAEADDIYVPKLWCYDDLNFLQVNVNVKPPKAYFSSTSSNIDDFTIDGVEEVSSSSNSTSTNNSTNPRKRKQKQSALIDVENVKKLLMDRKERRYGWLSEQVVFQINNIRSEEIQEEAAWNIQCILRKALKKDKLASKLELPFHPIPPDNAIPQKHTSTSTPMQEVFSDSDSD